MAESKLRTLSIDFAVQLVLFESEILINKLK